MASQAAHFMVRADQSEARLGMLDLRHALVRLPPDLVKPLMTSLAAFHPLHVMRTRMTIDAAFSFGRSEDHIPLGGRGFAGKMRRDMALAASDRRMGAS